MTTAGHQVTARFKVDRVIDGDTIVVQAIDLGYHVQTTAGIEYRLLRINCPEVHGPTKAAGLAAAAFTQLWLHEHAAHDPAALLDPLDGWLWATTEKTDSFGRYLADVNCTAGHNLSDDLVASGNAVPFMLPKGP